MWEISNTFQLLSFARSIGFGVILCLVYDILRSFRRRFDYSAVTIFFQDIIFSLLSAFFMFIMLLSLTNGELRGYIFLGTGIGYVVTRCTLSVIWYKILCAVLSRVNVAFLWFFRAIYKGFDSLEKNIVIFLKKTGKTLKKLLKR